MVILSKNNIVAFVGFFIVTMVAFVFSAEAGKVQVCHATSSESNPTVEIVISESALQKHLDHGDSLYDSVLGCEGDGGGDDGGGPSPV